MNNYKPRRKSGNFFGFITIITLLVFVLVGCPSPTSGNGTETGPYTITMQIQGSGTANASPNPAEEGDLVTITATPNDGYVFDKWAVVSGGVSLSSTTAESATFTMPSAAVTIRAEFAALPPNTPNLIFVPVVEGKGGSFESMSYGYTQPDARIINLHNSGTGAATIASWDIDDTEDAFEITVDTDNLNIAIHADHEITVQPKADLAPGVYNAVITVTYDEGKTAILNLNFTVTALPISAAAVNVTAPARNAAPASTATITTAEPKFEFTSVTWNPVHDPFKPGNQYTATVTLTADKGYTFAGIDGAVTIGGVDATIVGTPGETLVMSRQYAALTPDYVVTLNSGIYIITSESELGHIIIQDAVNYIRGEASGSNVNIQFGSGGANVLDIGTAFVIFQNAGAETWGDITLSGSITSAYNFSSGGASSGAVRVLNDISVTSTGTITNTAEGGVGDALFFNSTGTLKITDGIIQANTGVAIRMQTSNIEISGGLITSVINYTIFLASNGTGKLTMSGGEVRNTSAERNAIQNQYNPGVIEITGGIVSAINNQAIYQQLAGSSISISQANSEVPTIISSLNTRTGGGTIGLGNGVLNISGGTVQNMAESTNAIAIYNNVGGGSYSLNISGGKVEANTGMAILQSGSSFVTISGTALVTSANTDSNQGTIRLTGGALEINAGTVQNTAHPTNENARSITRSGGYTVEINGGTVTPMPTWMQ